MDRKLPRLTEEKRLGYLQIQVPDELPILVSTAVEDLQILALPKKTQIFPVALTTKIPWQTALIFQLQKTMRQLHSKIKIKNFPQQIETMKQTKISFSTLYLLLIHIIFVSRFDIHD